MTALAVYNSPPSEKQVVSLVGAHVVYYLFFSRYILKRLTEYSPFVFAPDAQVIYLFQS